MSVEQKRAWFDPIEADRRNWFSIRGSARYPDGGVDVDQEGVIHFVGGYRPRLLSRFAWWLIGFAIRDIIDSGRKAK